MKQIFSVLGIAVMLSACTYNAKKEEAAKQQAVAAIKDSLKLDSFKRNETERVALAAKQAEDERVAARVREEKRELLLAERNEAAPVPRTYTQTETATRKKGWSSAAKGTLIGAGAGALGGILIDKKDGRGAIIGGLAGAGAGYLIGRDKDRKSGRVTPKN
ncbi:MAG: membrane lipoprotein lipid attachment site-containing protein [Pedobacter sp.]|nr:membrane lipoprotein lipid attachment site-containing protein [Pedobacter sp.]